MLKTRCLVRRWRIVAIMTRRVSRPAENAGVTKLMMAVSECNMGKVKRLISAGGDLQARDKHGRNVLYHAFAGSEMTEGSDCCLSYFLFLWKDKLLKTRTFQCNHFNYYSALRKYVQLVLEKWMLCERNCTSVLTFQMFVNWTQRVITISITVYIIRVLYSSDMDFACTQFNSVVYTRSGFGLHACIMRSLKQLIFTVAVALSVF